MSWLATKVKVDRAALEEPLPRLVEELQRLADLEYAILGVRQDTSDGAWVIYYDDAPI